MLFVSRSFPVEKVPKKRWHLSVPPNPMLLIHPSFFWLWQVWGPNGALVPGSVCWLRSSAELGTNTVMAILANVGNSSVPWKQNALTKRCVQLLYKLHLAQEAVSNWVAVCRSRGTCCTWEQATMTGSARGRWIQNWIHACCRLAVLFIDWLGFTWTNSFD